VISAYGNLNGYTYAFRQSSGISSVTVGGPGALYTFNFTTAAPTADFIALASYGNANGGGSYYAINNPSQPDTPSSTTVTPMSVSGVTTPAEYVYVAIIY